VIQGDRKIPESRATGATSLMITQDCDRPIDERKGFADPANVKRGSETSADKGEKITVKPYRTRLLTQQEDWKAIRGRGGVVESPS